MFIIFLVSCKTETKDTVKFEKAKWVMQENNDYPHRNAMLHDLVYNVPLKGLHCDSLINLLGAPTRIDSSYLFYRVEQKRIGFFPLHTRTLVIKMAADSTVAWRKIHE